MQSRPWPGRQRASDHAATDYGRILLLKLALVVGLLGLAAINRLVLTPALERAGAARSGCGARSPLTSRSPRAWSC